MQATGSFPLSRIINGPFDPEGKLHNNGCNAKYFLGNGEDSTRRKRRKALPHFTASLPYGGKFTGITSFPKGPNLNDKMDKALCEKLVERINRIEAAYE